MQAPAPNVGVDTAPRNDGDNEDDDEDEDDQDDELSLEEQPEAQPEVSVPDNLQKVARKILADQPRVTRFPIDWDV